MAFPVLQLIVSNVIDLANQAQTIMVALQTEMAEYGRMREWVWARRKMEEERMKCINIESFPYADLGPHFVVFYLKIFIPINAP